MQYAMLDSETTPEIHVLPVDKYGAPAWPHEPHANCPCHPWRDDYQPLLFIHDHVQ